MQTYEQLVAKMNAGKATLIELFQLRCQARAKARASRKVRPFVFDYEDFDIRR